MYIIKNNLEHTIEIKKSKFICNLIKINSIDEIDNYLNDIREKYKGSKHNCYAYILNNHKKASDDKEPSGTAGIPMLNILEQKKLDNILVIVTRYFGGIKLGTGGLFKAYTTVLKETIELADIDEKKEIYIYEIKLDYEKIKKIDYILNNCQIISKNFDNEIIYKISTDENINEILINNNIDIITFQKTY